MKVIEPSFDLYTTTGAILNVIHGEDMLRWIEKNARISHRSEEAQTPRSFERFIQAVILDHADWSVAEHASVTAILRVDRGITHELVRHRHFSITQESTRFVNGEKKYKKDLEFIKPQELKMTADGENYAWRDSIAAAENAYFKLLHDGNRPQEARSILPNALAATISLTANLRSWRHFFLMRTSRETHVDLKRVSVPMLGEFQRCIPLLYSDIIPETRQIDNLRKPR